jgi:hypothetical protein
MGVAFVVGPYTRSATPQQNCVHFKRESGLGGAVFEALVTCEKGIMVVNYHDASPVQAPATAGIKVQRLDSEAYRELRDWAPNADRRTVIRLW